MDSLDELSKNFDYFNSMDELSKNVDYFNSLRDDICEVKRDR